MQSVRTTLKQPDNTTQLKLLAHLARLEYLGNFSYPNTAFLKMRSKMAIKNRHYENMITVTKFLSCFKRRIEKEDCIKSKKF